MHNYQLIPDQQLGYILFKDGRQAYCPFVAPFVVPSQIKGGGVEVKRMSCNTTCPLCNIFEKTTDPGEPKVLMLGLACGAGDTFEGVTIADKPLEIPGATATGKVLQLT